MLRPEVIGFFFVSLCSLLFTFTIVSTFTVDEKKNPSLCRMSPARPWERLWWTQLMFAMRMEIVSVFCIIQYLHLTVAHCWNVVLCNFSPGPSQMLQVADAICVQLSSRQLLGNSGDNGGESREKLLLSSSGSQSSSTNPRLISH